MSRFVKSLVACLYGWSLGGFFGDTLSGQSELFENFLNCSDWLGGCPTGKLFLCYSWGQAIGAVSNRHLKLNKV